MNGTTIRRKIFEFIIEHQARWRDLPGVYELRVQFGGMTEDVDLHLEQLEREGLLRLKGDGTIDVQPTLWQAPAVEIYNSLPVCRKNRFAGGGAISGSIFFDLRNLGIDTEADLDGFVVLDDSMADAGIQCGDIAILTHRTEGDIVGVRMEGGLTLRRIVRIHGIPHYLAENSLRPELRPTYEVPAYGTLWGVIRAGLAGRPRSEISYSMDQPALLAATRSSFGGVAWPPPKDTTSEDKRSVPRFSCQRSQTPRKTGKKATPSSLKKKRFTKFPLPPPNPGLNEPLPTD